MDPETGLVDDADREAIAAAEIDPELAARLLLDSPAPPEFVWRYQQTTPAVVAKGIEDTAFYRYAPLLALNDVGGLTFSWEYPPVIEGGLGRHVRKLSEQLVALGVEVHVVTRGGGALAPAEERHGVIVHRVTEPPFPVTTSTRSCAGWRR